MTLKNSQTEPTFWALIRDYLQHNRVLIALSLLGSFLSCPSAYLFWYTNSNVNERITHHFWESMMTKEEIRQGIAHYMVNYLNEYHSILQLIILMPGACLVAFIGWRYLFNHSMSDLYHSMPVTRTKRFLAQWFGGFLIWFVPFTAGNLFILIACCSLIHPTCWNIFLAGWAKMLLLLVLCYLIVYHVCLLAVMLSGNVLTAICNLLLLGLLTAVAYFTPVIYGMQFFDTYIEEIHLNDGIASTIFGLSPLITPVYLIYRFVMNTLFGENIGLLICSVLLCGINFAAAFVLYEKRKSESAGKGLDHKILRPVFRFAVSLLAGLWLALFFSRLASRTLALWMVFGGILGSALSFCVLNVIYHANMKDLFAHKLQLVSSALITCVLALSCRYDLWGYDNYLPAENSIRGISLQSYSLCDSAYIDGHSDDEYLKNAPVISEDSAQIHNLLSSLRDTGDYGSYLGTINVRVNTTYGTYYRSYEFFEDDAEALKPFLTTDAFMEKQYPLSTGQIPAPERIELTSLDGYQVFIVDREQIQELYDAYQADFRENFCSDGIEEQLYRPRLNYMQMIYGKEQDSDADSFNTYTYTREYPLALRDNYTRSTALLQKWFPEGAWTQEEACARIKELEFSFTLIEDTLEEYFGLVSRPSQSTNSKDVQYNYYYTTNYDNSSDYYEYTDDFTGETVAVRPESGRRYYSLTLNDPTQIDKLRPYLAITNGSNTDYDIDYVYIGRAYMNADIFYRCYIRLGTMPEDILAQLKAAVEEN